MRDTILHLDMCEKSTPERSKKNKTFIYFFMFMVNFRSMDDSRYTGFREIMDPDVLDLQSIYFMKK